MVDYYKILGLPRDATTSQIKARYQYLAKKYHPDHNGNDKAMMLINKAYEILSSPRSRFLYNNSLDAKRRQDGQRTLCDSSSGGFTYEPIKRVPVQANDKAVNTSSKYRFSIIFGLAGSALVIALLIFGISGNLLHDKKVSKLQVNTGHVAKTTATAASPAANGKAVTASLAQQNRQANTKAKQDQAIVKASSTGPIEPSKYSNTNITPKAQSSTISQVTEITPSSQTASNSSPGFNTSLCSSLSSEYQSQTSTAQKDMSAINNDLGVIANLDQIAAQYQKF